MKLGAVIDPLSCCLRFVIELTADECVELPSAYIERLRAATQPGVPVSLTHVLRVLTAIAFWREARERGESGQAQLAYLDLAVAQLPPLRIDHIREYTRRVVFADEAANG